MVRAPLALVLWERKDLIASNHFAKLKKIFVFLLSAIVLAGGLSGCAVRKEHFGFVFGTSVSIYLYEPSPEPTISAIMDELKGLEKQTSTISDESDIFRINNSYKNVPISVAPATFFLLKRAKELYAETQGAFNPALFPLVRLWHFDPMGYTGLADRIPSAAEIEQTLAYCDFDFFVLDEDTQSVTKIHEHAQLDLGGITKGYAADLAVSKIRNNGFLAIGGTIAVKGDPKRIGIQSPRSDNMPFGVFTLGDGLKVSTSGDYERYYVYDGIHYHHIIGKDGYPSGYGQENPPISVTVVAADGLLTDVLSTAFMILPLDEAERIAEKYGCKGVIIYANKTFSVFGDFEFDLINDEYTPAE